MKTQKNDLIDNRDINTKYITVTQNISEYDPDFIDECREILKELLLRKKQLKINEKI